MARTNMHIETPVLKDVRARLSPLWPGNGEAGPEQALGPGRRDPRSCRIADPAPPGDGPLREQAEGPGKWLGIADVRTGGSAFRRL